MAVKEKIRIRIKGYDHQVVDQFDLPHPCGVLLIAHFHFQSLRDAEVQRHARSGTRHAVKAVRKRRIGHHAPHSIALHLFVIPITVFAEIGGIAEAHRRRNNVTDSLNLVAEYLTARDLEAIHLRRCTYR